MRLNKVDDTKTGKSQVLKKRSGYRKINSSKNGAITSADIMTKLFEWRLVSFLAR